MFVCQKSFEIPVPPLLREPGSGYYRAVELSLQMPWFIITYLVQEDGGSFLRSVCCSWESDLIDLIDAQALAHAGEPSPPTRHAVASLQQVVPHALGTGWTVRDIRSVWVANEVPSNDRVVIVEDVSGTQFCCTFPSDEPPIIGERRLVATIGV
jgi:hypothetical protein